MYYIYHIPGVKIGVSSEPTKRVANQGYTDFEILEQHTDIEMASDREIELQIQYFGKRDNRARYVQSIEARRHAGKIGGLWAVESGQLASIRSKAGKNGSKIINSIERTCPHCNTNIKGPSYFRYHGDRCKNIN
jgi:hypothetical protein